jgi:hypothetical protein
VGAVGDALLKERRRPQVERQVDLAELRLAAHVEAGAGEDAEHRAVAGHHLGVEAHDAARGGDLGELLEHPRPQAAPLHLVGDGEGHLGGGRLAQAVVAGDGNHAPAEVGEQDDARVAVGVGVVARDGVRARDAVEAQVAALRRERVEEHLDVCLVLGLRRAEPQGGSVAQDDVADERGPGRSTPRRRALPPSA